MSLLLLLVITMACSSSDENVASNGKESFATVDYYGIQIPYEPLEDKDMPSWLIEAKSTWEPDQILLGIYNNKPVYHFNSVFDSSIIGHFYDENGNLIDISSDDDFQKFLSGYRDVRCIYYRKGSDTKD